MVEAAGIAETGRARWVRRGISICAYALGFALLLVLAPLALPLLWVADRVAGGRWSLARLALFGIIFLGYELVGLLWAAVLWLAAHAFPRLRGERGRIAHERLQRWWAESLFGAASRCFRLTLEVEGADAATPGPVIVMMRHASLADTLLPAVLLGGRGLRLRYVLKRELLWDPCLDVVGQRLPNAFIRRGRGESDAEIEAIRALGRDLGDDEGVLIYPEGTRFTAAKRERALARLAASDRPELLARARKLVAVLPPRSAGPLALLDAAAAADVLLVAHSGLEGLASVADIARAGAVGRRIRVRIWRVPRTAIPVDREAQLRWLYDEWARVNAFVAGQMP